MDNRNLKEQLLRSTAEIFRRAHAFAARVPEESKAEILPGDVFLFPEGNPPCFEWVAAARATGKGKVVLVVPADIMFLVGSTDLKTAAETPLGPLVLRCRYCVWVNERNLDPKHRIGSLPPEEAERVQDKLTEVLASNSVGSAAEPETDSDLDYKEWMREVAKAALAFARRGAPASLIDYSGLDSPLENASRRGLPLAAA